MSKKYRVEMTYIYDPYLPGRGSKYGEFDTLEDAKTFVKENESYDEYLTEFKKGGGYKTVITRYELDSYTISEVIEKKENLYTNNSKKKLYKLWQNFLRQVLTLRS